MKFRKFWIRWREPAACILAGIVLFLLFPFWSAGTGLSGENGIFRNSYGQGEKIETILVDGLTTEELLIDISVSERQYGEKEADSQFGKALEAAKASVLGENLSLEEVRYPLTFSSWLSEYGMEMKWESGNEELVDSYGTLFNEECGKEGEDMVLFLKLTAGEYQKNYEIPIHILPPYRTEEEKITELFKKRISQLDQSQRYEESLTLPLAFEGKDLSYRSLPDMDRYLFLLLGIAAGVLMELRHVSEQKNEKKRRREELLFDYSDIVSGLCVYLGAGFSVRTAFIQLREEYQRSLKRQGRRQREGYERISDMVSNMEKGMPELQAYAEFGRICGLRPYQKLAGLLEQYVKNGSGSLRKSLEDEMEQAFEERKAVARRLGEEAGTKLLIPLFMMLLVVMVMVSVPAFLSFGV